MTRYSVGRFCARVLRTLQVVIGLWVCSFHVFSSSIIDAAMRDQAELGGQKPSLIGNLSLREALGPTASHQLLAADPALLLFFVNILMVSVCGVAMPGCLQPLLVISPCARWFPHGPPYISVLHL